MQQTAEQQSLNRVKQMAFCHKQRELALMLTNYEPMNIIDTKKNIFENLPFYINNNRNKFVGMGFEDIKKVCLALHSAKFNDSNHKTQFPDFVLKNGFIEHFKVTSSKENRKGSAKKILEVEQNRIIEPEKDLFIQQFEQTANTNPTQHKQWLYKDVNYSYENFVISFKKQFEKHVNSFSKYKGNKEFKIFLIEYADFGLTMIEDSPININEQYPKEPKQYFNYFLSKDKQMLNYVFKFKDKIDYIILDLKSDFEIIKVNKIQDVLASVPYNYIILGGSNYIRKKVIATRMFYTNENEKEKLNE